MRQHPTLHIAALCLSLLGLTAAQAEPMSSADHKASKTHISETYKTDKAACKALSGNAKDVCTEEAKAKEKVALAELEFKRTGKASDQSKLQEVKAKTAFAVAKERCGDKSGNARMVCIEEAKAAEQKALADLQMDKRIGEAQSDAAAQKTDADHRLALEKCDTLAGEAKASCMAQVKAKFGKK